MCGIAGILYRNGNKVQKDQLKKMTDSIVHRGPDGEGFWESKDLQIGLGHRRLSIIDLSVHANQPMPYKDRYIICFNGEVYNYIELKEMLLQRGLKFETESDTEVLLSMYAEFGPKCLEQLDGMFAISIWDKEKEELFIARDRFGEKPFYYYNNSDKFVFCSEMKGLWAYGIPKRIEKENLNYFLETGNARNPQKPYDSFFENIFEVPNAHYALVKKDSDQIEFQRYYDIDLENKTNLSFEQAVQKFNELFTISVKRRLRSDVPVGSSLSGGLDSSAVVSTISKVKSSEQNQMVFSAKFPGFKKDESRFIDLVVKEIGNVKDFEIIPTEKQLEESIKEIIHYQEEPFRSASIFAQWSVMNLVKDNGVTVVLDGQGADEFLGGYLGYYITYLQQEFIHNKKNYKKELKAYNSLRNESLKGFEKNESLRMKLGRLKAKVLNSENSITKNDFRKRLKHDMLQGNLLNLLRYADRNAMAHQIETRLPFLNHELVDFVFSLPDSYLLSEGWTKLLLRKSIENDLASDIVWRIEKVGYEPPQKKWLEEKWAINRIQKISELRDENNNENDNLNWRYLVLSYYSDSFSNNDLINSSK